MTSVDKCIRLRKEKKKQAAQQWPSSAARIQAVEQHVSKGVTQSYTVHEIERSLLMMQQQVDDAELAANAASAPAVTNATIFETFGELLVRTCSLLAARWRHLLNH